MFDAGPIFLRAGQDLHRLQAMVSSESRMSALDWVLACSVVGLPHVAVKHLLFGGGSRAKRRRRYLDTIEFSFQLLRDSMLAVAYPLMVNTLLKQPNAVRSPGLFFAHLPASRSETPMSFDESVDLGGTICELSMGVAPDGRPELAAFQTWAQQVFEDEEFQFGRRRMIDPKLASRPNVYLCDLVVDPLLLPDGHMSGRTTFLPVLAEPGPRGATVVMPHWLVTGAPPISPMHDYAWLESLAAEYDAADEA